MQAARLWTAPRALTQLARERGVSAASLVREAVAAYAGRAERMGATAIVTVDRRHSGAVTLTPPVPLLPDLQS